MMKVSPPIIAMREVGQHVVTEIRRRGGREYVGAVTADHQGVAVGVRARDLDGTYDAAAADPVLDVELLLEGLRQLLGGDAPQPVGGAGRRERHDHLHGPVGPVLRVRNGAGREDGEKHRP
jgi:hypothetical protein